MNILFSTEYYMGNPDLVRLSIELARRGHQVSVLTSFPPAFYTYESPDVFSGVDVFEANPHFDVQNIPYTVSFPLMQIAKLIRSRKIEVCHTIMERATNAATVALISKAMNVPYVHTVQGIGTKTGRPFVDFIGEVYKLMVSRMVLKWAKRVIVLSEGLAEYAIRLGASSSHIAVISSGIDCSYFDPGKHEVVETAKKVRDKIDVEDEVIIGYIGRLVPVKGLKYLLTAMNEVQREYANTHLLMVGDGFQKKELKRMSDRLKINATFVGWEKDVLPFYAAIDIFVLPSVLEGLSNSLLEAMAMGKPVIATDVGGNKDVIVDGENGFLIPSGNPSSMSSKLKRLIEREDLRKEMGSINRETVKRRFSWEDTVSKVESVYKNLID
jgi:glycosyltransferase involved in cell wall biosynthesis